MLEQTPSKAKQTRLLLPFSTCARDRTLPFTEEMEQATIFSIVESDRRKSQGMFLKKPIDQLAFIAKSCYPIWLQPWSGKTLLLDGLGVSTRTLACQVLPDVKKFISDIEISAQKRQAYAAALDDHRHYFQSAKKVEEKTTLGLITNPDFLRDFQIYLAEAEETDEAEVKEMCLSPIIDESATSSTANELSELKSALERDIESLRDAMKLIDVKTKQHVDAIREEMKKILVDLNEKITAAKASAMEKIKQIQVKYDERILKTSRRFEKQLQELNQELAKLEKSQDRTIAHIERCNAEIQSFRTRRNSAGERRWKEEKDKWKREAAALKKDMESLDVQIQQTESQKTIEISNVRAEFNIESEEAMKDVRELEATKESEIKLSQQEVRSLEDSTSTLVEQLDNLTKQKRASAEELDRIGMREQRRKTVLAYVPFYLACFKAAAKRKYVVYSPAIAGSMKALTKFKSMFGVSKAKSLYQQRSRAITHVLNQLIVLVERDPVFEKELHDAGVHANILQSAESRERIYKGLKDLRDEEWISTDEVQNLTALLKSFQSRND